MQHLSQKEDDQTIRNVKCPRCKNKDVSRIPRGWLVKKLFPKRDVKHYQCFYCFNKFYKF